MIEMQYYLRNITLAVLILMPTLWSLEIVAQMPQAPANNPRETVIIDSDIGDDIDDVLAFGLAVSSPELNILGVTTAWGDTSLRARMVDRLLEELHRTDIAVAEGVIKHGPGEAQFSQRRWAERGPVHQHPRAVDFLLQQIDQHPGQITLIAVGPLTNVAAAYQKCPDCFRKLKRIVMMAGAVDRGYDDLGYLPNQGPSPEYNIAMDIPAAKIVFTAGVPIFLMPLDSTQLKLDEVLRQILFTQSNSLTDALTLLYQQWARVTKQETPTVFDAMAVAYVLQPQLCPATPVKLGITDNGLTRRDPNGTEIQVCLHSDSDQFFRFFIPRLANFPYPEGISKTNY